MSLDNTPQPSVKYCADKVNAKYTSPASLSAMVWALSKRLVAPPQFCEGAGIKALLQKRIDPPGEPDTDLANDIWHRDLNSHALAGQDVSSTVPLARIAQLPDSVQRAQELFTLERT